MNIQNNVRFGMIYGPFSTRPDLSVKNQILERTNQPGPLVRVRRESIVQNPQQNQQVLVSYYLVSGDKDKFEMTHAMNKAQSERENDREDARVFIEEMFDRAVNPSQILDP